MAELADVSIALATYNGARYLEEQLRSLARQTLPVREVVITDDGSTDTTLDVVREFAQSVSFPVRIYSNENRLGFAENFLKAALLCKGQFIAFCDQDDVWDERKLSLCSSYLSDANVSLCTHSAQVWDGKVLTGQLFPEFKKTKIYSPASLDPWQLVSGFTMVFRANLLKMRDNSVRPRHIMSLGHDPCPMAHDAWVWFLATTVGKVATIADSLALYRQHGSNAVGVAEGVGFAQALNISLTATQYSELADLESESSRIVLELSQHLDSPQTDYAQATAQNIAFRSQLHSLRSMIYDPQSNVLIRSKSFMKIMRSGGYRSDMSKTRLGLRAAIKDACLGVSGINRSRTIE